VGFADRLKAALAHVPRGKLRILLPTAVLLLAVLGAMQWRLHRTIASTPSKPAETTAPAAAGMIPDPNTSAPDLTPVSTPATKPAPVDKTAKPKDANNAAKASTTPPPPPEKQVSLLDDTALRTPQAMPKTAVAKVDDPIAAGMPGQVPGGVPNGMSNLMKDVSVATPKMPAQKIRVSSGVAQGQLIHQVTPVYPLQAKLSGIQGTVVLQAVVGKDGSVQNVHAVRGPPMLVQSALDAVKQWRYKPFSVNGEPAEAEVEVNVKFNP
jgi:protein TonB